MSTRTAIAWPRIFAEAGAVVLSILLAFWIDAWWDGRKEEAAEHRYLLALRDDFTQVRDGLENYVRFADDVMRRSEQMFALLVDPQTDFESDAFSLALGDFYAVTRPNLGASTYDDMLNSGNLSLVDNTALRLKMAKMVQLLEEIDDHSVLVNETYWSHHASFVDRHFVVSDLGWFTNNDPLSPAAQRPHLVERVRLMARVPDAPFTNDAAAARSREFWNLVNDWVTGYGDLLSPLLEARLLVDSLLEDLDAELARRDD
jgi:hypothetical protein